MTPESFHYKIYEYFMMNQKPRMLPLTAARAACTSRKVKLKATHRAEACYFLQVGYGDPVRVELIIREVANWAASACCDAEHTS